MVNAKVIVIESSDSEARVLQALLRFLDLEPLHVRDLAELRQSPHVASQDCLAVIVGSRSAGEPTSAASATIRSLAEPSRSAILSRAAARFESARCASSADSRSARMRAAMMPPSRTTVASRSCARANRL